MPPVGSGEPARKRVRLDSDERRALILASARKLFSSRPYSEVSMVDLAEAAGVARGLLHHYFGSKRELYLAVVRDVVQVATVPVPAEDPALRTTQIWEASVDRWLDFTEANRDRWISAANAGGVGHDPEVASILDAAREVVAEQALKAIGIDDPTPTLLAVTRGYGGLTEELTREWLIRGRLTRDQVRTVLVGSLPLLIRELLPRVAEVPRRPRRSG